MSLAPAGATAHRIGGELSGDVRLTTADGVVVDDIIMDDERDVQQLHGACRVDGGCLVASAQTAMCVDEQPRSDQLAARGHSRQRLPELPVLCGDSTRPVPCVREHLHESVLERERDLVEWSDRISHCAPLPL